MIGIRVDGNEKIGMGHISRCLSIASALKKRGVNFCFICSGDTSITHIVNEGYQVFCVEGSSYDNWNLDEETRIEEKINVSVLFIDSYYVKDNVLKELHKDRKVIILDDLNLFDYDVDAIINYNIEAGPLQYRNTKHPLRKEYIGVDYFPLRATIVRREKRIRKSISNVLITTGGTDPFQCTEKILSSLRVSDYPDITFTVILGLFFGDDYCMRLKASYCKWQNVNFVDWGQDMQKKYNDNDLVIAPGSTTLYEALSLGVPCISFQFIDNQHPECIALDKLGLAPYAGDFSQKNDGSDLRRLFVSSLSYYTRKTRNKKMKSFFDGKGSDRIASILVEYSLED